ncbi:MAG TPA: ABC transporter substrate-binding protein [Stellaceae bacterium]|nr:ABC transporter substrate-binding protein [Stellaceae bacterium]
MNRRTFLAVAAGMPLWWPIAIRAQQTPKPVVGFLSGQSRDTYRGFADAFRQGLGEAGYVEGRDVVVEYRWGEGRPDALSPLAADLVRRGVAVIAATGGVPSARAAKAATSSIPIVFNCGEDPVEAGLVASLNRPGGNMTGVTWFSTDVMGKRLGLLKELIPAATAVGMIVNPNDPEGVSGVKTVEAAAAALHCRLVVVKAGTPGEIDAAFAALAREQVGGLVVAAGAFFVSRRAQIIALAARDAIPTIYPYRDGPENGGLISYGNSLTDAYRRNAAYVARILKGERPGDLPIDRSTKFELIINKKTADELGLAVPRVLLAQADEVFE